MASSPPPNNNEDSSSTSPNPSSIKDHPAFTIHNIKAHVPIVLDLHSTKYTVWAALHTTHATSVGVFGHLDGSALPPTPKDPDWVRLDALVTSWIYQTISENLLTMILTPLGAARDYWSRIKKIFQDNMDARSLQLAEDFRTISMGTSTVSDYCQRLKFLADSLADVGTIIDDRELVLQLLHGLSPDYKHVANIIKYQKPLPSFLQARTMLIMEEPDITKNSGTTVSPSTVLYAANSSSHSAQQPVSYGISRQHSSGFRGGPPGRSGPRRGNRRGRGRGSFPWQPFNPNWPSPYTAPGWPNQNHWPAPPSPWASQGASWPNWPQPLNTPGPGSHGVLGSAPRPTGRGSAQLAYSGPLHQQLPSDAHAGWASHGQQLTDLPAAFTAMNLHQPTDSQWYLDSGATSHLTSSSAYESQHAPENCKENARQQPRVDPVISDKRYLSSNNQGRVKSPTLKKNLIKPAFAKSYSDNQRGSNLVIPKITIDETLRAKSFGNHRTTTEETPSSSKITAQTLTDDQRNNDNQQIKKLCLPEITKEEHHSEEKATNQDEIDKITEFEEKEKPSIPQSGTITESAKTSNGEEQEQEQEKKTPTTTTTMKTITETVSEKLAPAYATVSEATSKITSKIQGLSIPSLTLQGSGGVGDDDHNNQLDRKWDKGVSVKEYFKNKLEPGEDERALSQVISEVISPKRNPSEKGVVEKVKEAVTLMLHTDDHEEETSATNSSIIKSSQIPVSTNAHEVEEENQGRILQTN